MDFTEYCAPGASCKEEMISVSGGVSLRVIRFTPARKGIHPHVVFVPGWISLMRGWQVVLREMTKDFEITYIETREKISSRAHGNTKFGVKDIGDDIVRIISGLGLVEKGYVLMGSSLGATVILDCFKSLAPKPLCLVLVGPNAVFRVPRTWIAFIHIFYPGFYLLLKPVIKWYLRTFRMDVHADYAQYQKYCSALDAADPWKLKKAVIPFSRYQVWDLLPSIDAPTLIFGASRDKLHEPENLKKMVSLMPRAVYVDMETNQGTHSESMVSELRKYLGRLKNA
jgi:pimeloyl-ACP methyl ester carboxylesterase